MNAARRTIAAAAVALLALAGRAQDGASTLAANLDAADAVVVAAVTAVHAPQPETIVVQLRVEATIAGGAPATFALAEPAGACCGRSLFALRAGDVRLVFLRRSGPAWHVLGGARGMLAAQPDVIAHLRTLAAAATPSARAATLVAALAHDEARVADDAALALAAMPALALDAPALATVGDAMRRALDQRAARALPLLDVAMRSGDAGLRDAALARYLAAKSDDDAALLRQGLQRATAPGTVELAVAGAVDETAGMRAAELVAALPADRAVPTGLQMLRQAANPRVQLKLCQDLLRRGVTTDQLGAAPARVVDAARRLLPKAAAYRVLPREVR